MNDFNIQAASAISGVPVHQIRSWEKRYNAVRPKRLDNNFRSYTQEDIMRFKLLGILTRHGISISKIASLETAELQSACDMLAANDKLRVDESLGKDSKEKLSFLLAFLKSKKLEILKHEVTKFHTLDSVIEVLIPLMKQVILHPDFRDDEKQNVVVVLVEQINKISTKTQKNSYANP